MVACRWHIKYPPGSRVRLTIDTLDVEEVSDCRYDFIRVYGGEDETSPQLLHECKKITSEPETLSSHGNHMLVVFVSDNVITGMGFRATYQRIYSGCGGWFTASSSAIISPNYPLRYAANDDCQWTVRVDPLHTVILEFDDFELPSSINCTKGVVMVYDGFSSDAPLLMEHCGDMPNNSVINSSNNGMTIRLKADGQNVAKGFHARYKTGCGAKLSADDGGEITSLNYPHANPSLANCSWVIFASDPGNKVTLTLTHIDFMGRTDCENIFLEIRDGDQPDSHLIQKICDSHVPPPITSQGNSLHVFLRNRGLFRATYGISSSYCGGEYNSQSGTFSSPDYPNSYPMESECIWIISASAGNKVLLSFSAFHVEQSEHCNMDYVEVHEDSAAGPLIGRYCGNQVPTNITAAHKIWIKFRSDDMGTAQGFIAHFGLVHGSDLNGTSGVIESPGYPHPFRREDTFQWQITVPYGQYVSISFSSISISVYSSNQQGCSAGLKIFDGPDENAPQLGDSICGYIVPDPLLSHGNQVTIKFIGRAYLPSLWRLQWNAVDETSAVIHQLNNSESSCYHELHLNSTGSMVIQSPGFPNYYDNNLNCTWIVQSPSHDHIKLNFSEVSLEGSTPYCSYDRIDVYTLPNAYVESWDLNFTTCGRQSNLILESVSNVLKIQFTTDFMVKLRGFNLTAETACGSIMSGSSGVINSSDLIPYLSHQHVQQYECNWVINVRSRRTILISFDSFNIPTTGTSCNPSYLMILNGGNINSPVLGNARYCGSTIPSVPESASNQVFVRLLINSFSSGSPQFILRYSEVSIGCGGQVFLSSDGSSQYIQSPNYPSPPPHDIECGWTIMSPPRTRIRIDFDDEFHFSQNCFEGEDVEYVQLYDGGTELAHELARFCYTHHASSVLSTGNALYVKYFTEARHPVSGFKAKLQIAECGGIITTTYAEIQSPKYPQNYDSGVECEWNIKLEYGYFSYLFISDLETPPNSDCHSTDYLEIRDQDKDGEILGTYCGALPNRTTIELPGNTAYIKFKADGTETRKGFHMYLYTDYRRRCGGYLELPSGVISTPDYPAASSLRHSCDWRIRAPKGRRVTLKFEEFNLRKDEQTGRCIHSLRLMILDNSGWAHVNTGEMELCGNSLPETIESSTSSVFLLFRSNGLAAGEGFIISYSTENEALCGGQLVPPNGTFGVENFSFTNRSWVECQWILSSDSENGTVAIKFNNFYIPGNMSNYCRNGSVQIYNSNERYSSYEPFCGDLSRRLPFITSPYKDTTVLLEASNRGLPSRFNASYNFNECGGVIDGYNSTITSPGYPNNYPVNIDCHWILRVPYGSQITLTTVDMKLDGDCSSDFVRIHNGFYIRSPVIDKLCGTTTPQPITSSTNAMTIVFHSDQYGTDRGFKMITGTVQEGCGGRIHRRQGFISSPNYPSLYDTNTECVWTIEYPPGFLVNITFIGRFDIEMHNSCDKDYLLIEDYVDGVWHEVAKKCGRQRPSDMLSYSMKMRITFHSDTDIKGDGFQLQYTAACGGHFTDSEGSIYSPNYPDFYEDNLHCKYLIGHPGQHVLLQFQPDDFSLEAHSECYYDYVAIYNGNTTASRLVGKYCGTEAPGNLTMFGPILVEFVTDYSYTGHGFVAHYEITACGGNLTAPSGTFRSTSRLRRSVQFRDCTWNIQGQENRIIALRFSHMNLLNTYSCRSQYIEVREWNSTGDAIVKFCGNRSNAVVKSSTNQISVRFQSNLYYMGQFEAAYRSTFGPAQGCGGAIISSTGEISSLDYDKDGMYEPDLDCSWTIMVTDDQIVNLTFSIFNLEEPVNGTCMFDFIEVRDGMASGDPVIGRYCGTSRPPSIISSSNKITVSFHSDSQENRPGFKATFTSAQTPCGPSSLLVTNETKSLSSVGYPSGAPPNTWCRWHFYLNDTLLTRVELIFKEMDISCAENDYIEVHSDQIYTPTYRLCGSNAPHDITATTGMWLSFKSGSASGKKFSLDYSSGRCNRTYTKDNGAITSPSFVRGIHCLMTIIAPEGQTISLYFNSISLSYSSDCESSSFKIYDGGNVSASILGVFCGYLWPNPIFSTGNKLTLKLDSEVGYGYYLVSYTTTDKGHGCGGRLSHTKGIFTSPLYPEAYNQSSECSWLLSVPGHHTMSLYFRTFSLSSTSPCNTNYVEIYEGHSEVLSNRVIRICGDEHPGTFNSQSSQFLVKLVTSTNNTSPGFVAHFQMNSRNFNMESQEVIQKSIPVSPAPGVSILDLS